MKTLGIMFVAMWTGLQAQELPTPFAAIIRALSLTELQVSQLQQSFPTADARKLAILNGTQRSKLASIEKALSKYGIASAAISLNLIEASQWPRGTLCLYPAQSYAAEFGLTDFQVRQLELLRQPFHALIAYKRKQQDELILALTGEPRRPHFAPRKLGPPPSREIDELDAEIHSLMRLAEGARPLRNLAWNVLNESQKVIFNEFQISLQEAGEAIDLGLLPRPIIGEPLCH